MKETPPHPFRQIFKGVDGDVLWVLARSKPSRHVADIARICGRSKSQVKNVLERLHEAKVADRQIFEGWSWNCLNDSHPFAPHLRAMARMDFEHDDVANPHQAGAPSMWSDEY